MIDSLVKLLSEDLGQNVFVCFNPDVFDFTTKSSPELCFYLKDKKEFKLLLTESNLLQVISLLKFSVFSKGMNIITWDWKNLCTYILAKTGRHYCVEGSIVDLKIIESFSGNKSKRPSSLIEALNRLKNLFSSGTWKEIEGIYRKLHLPLITSVIPSLETSGIISQKDSAKIFAHYEIDGQENGRLKCSKMFNLGYVPHAMSVDTKNSLKGRNFDEFFMSFDFKGQEVYQLAWLSKDPLLLELCNQQDVYKGLWEVIMEEKSFDKNNRDLAKKIFLPIIYGQSATMLSQRCGLSQSEAERIINRIDTLFPSVSTFIESYLKQVKEFGYAKDIFGKRRKFEENKEYLVRNFSVSSPSSVVCLEKLIKLHSSLKDKTDIAYTIHDGYVVYATKENWKTIFKIGYEALSGESEFCPGLKLKVAVKAGRNLNELKPLIRKGEL